MFVHQAMEHKQDDENEVFFSTRKTSVKNHCNRQKAQKNLNISFTKVLLNNSFQENKQTMINVID